MPSGGMDQESYALFLEHLKRYIKERLVPAEKQVTEADEVSASILKEMQELGLFGLSISEKYGGAGMSASQYLNTIVELSWAAPAYRTIISVGNGIFGDAIANYGTDQQKQKWLPAISKGGIASFAITEPDSGSDSAALRTKAEKRDNGYVLNGVKRYITNAPIADVVLVMARTSAEKLPKNKHISAFIIPTNTPGLSIGKADKKMGQSGSQIADVILEDVHVPESLLLGEQEGTGFAVAMNSLNNGRLSIAAASLGYSKRALDSGIRYAMQRKAFGEAIANFQLIQAKIADSKTDIYAMQCMLNDAASKLDKAIDIKLDAACLKMFASEACGRIVDRVVQIHGGAGYLQEYEAERFYRDSRIFRIYEGTTEIMQLVIAKEALKEYQQTLS